MANPMISTNEQQLELYYICHCSEEGRTYTRVVGKRTAGLDTVRLMSLIGMNSWLINDAVDQ